MTIAASALLLGETIEPSTLVFACIVISLVAVGRGMRITQSAGIPVVNLVYCRCKGE